MTVWPRFQLEAVVMPFSRRSAGADAGIGFEHVLVRRPAVTGRDAYLGEEGSFSVALTCTSRLPKLVLGLSSGREIWS